MEKYSSILKWVVPLVIGVLVYFNFKNYMYETHLLRDPIAAVITKVEHRSGGYQYHYKKRWFWAASFMPAEKQLLNVGDSVYKKRYSLKLATFRKNAAGKYVPYLTFDGDNRQP